MEVHRWTRPGRRHFRGIACVVGSNFYLDSVFRAGGPQRAKDARGRRFASTIDFLASIFEVVPALSQRTRTNRKWWRVSMASSTSARGRSRRTPAAKWAAETTSAPPPPRTRSRNLTNEDDVFTQNAWDDVELS